jgi:AbiU2
MNAARSKVFFDILESASDANTNWQIWWTIANRARPHLVPHMNHAPEFFVATERAHFNGIFINLAHLFDKRKDVSSIEKYLKIGAALFRPQEAKAILQRLAKFDAVRDGVLEVRNQVIAHKNTGLTERQVFQRAKLKPRQIGELIEATTDIVNFFAERENCSNRVYPSEPLIQAALHVIRAAGKADA